jgi:hypothetical protein
VKNLFSNFTLPLRVLHLHRNTIYRNSADPDRFCVISGLFCFNVCAVRSDVHATAREKSAA